MENDCDQEACYSDDSLEGWFKPTRTIVKCKHSSNLAFGKCRDSPKPNLYGCLNSPKLAFGSCQDSSKPAFGRSEDSPTAASGQHANCQTRAFGRREDSTILGSGRRQESPNLDFDRCQDSGKTAFGRGLDVPVFCQPTSVRLPPKVCLDAPTNKKRNYLVNTKKQPKTYLQKFRESISKTGIIAPSKECPVEVNSISVECGDTERESLTEDLGVSKGETDLFETEAYNEMVYDEILRGNDSCSCPGRVSDRSLPMFSGETVVAAMQSGANSGRSHICRSKSEVHRRRARTPGPPPQPPGTLGGLGPDLVKIKPYQERLKFVRQYSERVRMANKIRLSKKDKKLKEEELSSKSPVKIQVKEPIQVQSPTQDVLKTKDKKEVKKSLLKSIYKVPTEKYFSVPKSEYNLQEDLDKSTGIYKSNNLIQKPVNQNDETINVKHSSKNIETEKTHFNLTDRGTQSKVVTNTAAQFEERFILEPISNEFKTEKNVINKEAISTSVGESLTKLLNKFDLDIEEARGSKNPNTYYVLEKRERRESSDGNKFISRQESRETVYRGSNINTFATSQVHVMRLETQSGNKIPDRSKVHIKESRTPSEEVIEETQVKSLTDLNHRTKEKQPKKKGKQHRCDLNVRCGKKISPKISIIQSADKPMNVKFSVNFNGLQPSPALKKLEEKHRAYKEALKDLMHDRSLSSSVLSKEQS